MADGRQTHSGSVPGHRDCQPLCLNWAGCDMFGRDLLDLDEADSELLDSEVLNTAEFSEDAKGDLFRDINLNRQPPEGRRVSWGRVEASRRPVPKKVPGNTLLESPTHKSPQYPPTLLELEVQALAKIGVVKLYHDSIDLEREVAKAEEDRKLAIINRFDRERQALSPVPGQQPQQKEMVHISSAQTSGVSELLELQKVALSSMKGTQKSSAVCSTSALSPIPLAGGSDLLELQKVALSSMKSITQTSAPPSNVEGNQKIAQSSGPASGSNIEGDLLELQKVALASMTRLSEVLESHTPTPVSGPVPQSTAGGNLLKLQRMALANIMQKYQNEPSLSPILPTLQTTAPTKSPQQDEGSDLLELQKLALQSLRSVSKSRTSAPAPEQAKGGGESLELQKVAPKSASNQGPPAAPPAVVTQQTGGEDLLELQKLALRNIQNQRTPSPAPRHAERGADFQDLRKKNLPNIPRQTPPAQIRQQGREGGDLLELQKGALTQMSYGRGARAKYNTEGGGGISSSSPPVFNTMPAREPLEMLLQKLSSKDKALQSASRTIEEKDQRLQEYEASMANALDLLQCMNVRCTDAKEETAKVLTEVEEIVGNLTEACSAVENFDCIHALEGPNTAAPDDCHFFFGTENGLETSQVEIDERRNLVEELLRELGNIEVARKEAQQGFELQIQRNEQLIAELQRLDIAAAVVEGAACDRCENSSDQVKGNQTDHAFENTSDQAKRNLSDQAYEDPLDQAKKHLRDPVHEKPSDQPNGDLCDRIYENPTDQAKGNLRDHVLKRSSDQDEENSRDQACEISCAHVNGNPQEQVDEDPCDKAKGNPCDHIYESPNNPAKESLCDHVFEIPRALPDENSCDHAYEQTGDQSNENQCDHVYENPQDHSNENQCDHSYESPLDQANENRCDHSYEQTNEHPCDHDFESLSDVTSEIPTESTFECPRDLAYEDCRDSGPVREEEGIGNTSPSSAESEKQLADSLKEVESKVSAEIQSIKRTHQRKRPNCVARVSSPNALWEHLRHFVRKQPETSEVEILELNAQQIKLQGELESQLKHRTDEVSVLHEQMKEMRNALLAEQEKRKVLEQKAIDIHPWPTKADLEHKDKVIRKMHFQMHQLEAALRQEREENREALAQKAIESSRTQAMDDPALAASATVDMDNLRAILHSKDEQIRELDEKIARKEIACQAENHQMRKCIDDLETKLLVKEEEVIKLAHELEISRSSMYSQRPDELRFKGDNDVHFFHMQGKEDGREILDLRCEVLSLQDCLGIKTQAIKTMEKELARSYSIVTELRSKLRGLQEYERNSQKKGHSTNLTDRLRNTEEKLHRSESERVLTNRKIQDLSARCKYLEKFEHLHREGSNDKKEQAIMELQEELERNVQRITNMQARCNEYEARAKRAEARNNFDNPGRFSHGGSYDSRKPDHTKLVQLSEEKEALGTECDQLRSEMVRYQEENERKGKLLNQLQHDLQNLKKKQIPMLPDMHQRNDGEPRSAMLSDEGRPKNAMTATSSVLDLSKVESEDVNTLRELLSGQWRVQKVMEDRLNTMMVYISDRVNEFEREPSDTTSDSSFAATTELNHFHVEAKLMKLQLEQQLQVLRGTTFTSLPTSGVASPGQSPQNRVSTQNLQLLVEKTALEDSAQTLQEKTSRLLNRLTFMRTELNSH